MAKYFASNFYRKRKDRVIYAFVSPINKAFYMWHCFPNSLDETYRHHFKGRRYYTQKFMEHISPHRPCLFVLEEMPGSTTPETYEHILVWIRILTENGYTSYNTQETIEVSQDLFYQQNKYYLRCKDINIAELLSCERCMKPTYKQQTCERHSSYVAETKLPAKKAPPSASKSSDTR